MLSKKGFTLINRRTIKGNHSGFTLIELLIVLTIISVLSAIGLIAYNNFLKSSRDSKRQADLKLIQSALEDYHSDQLYYPPSITSDVPLKSADETKTYLNKVPKDPLSSAGYLYVADPSGCSESSCLRYCLYAVMERLPSYTDDPVKCPTNSNYNYAVTRP